MNGIIRKQINKRYKLLQIARKTPKGSSSWNSYKKQRNYCSILIRNAKSNYWKNKFDSSNNAISFWKTVNEFKGKVNKSSIGHLKNNNGDLITNDRDKATLLNQHFATIAEKLYKDRSFTELGSNHVEHIYRVTPSISTIKVSFNDNEKTFNKCVKSGRACGLIF